VSSDGKSSKIWGGNKRREATLSHKPQFIVRQSEMLCEL
jgi:hypothetical protein